MRMMLSWRSERFCMGDDGGEVYIGKRLFEAMPIGTGRMKAKVKVGSDKALRWGGLLKSRYSNAGNPVRECLSQTSGLGRATQGERAASKTGVEINYGIEIVYQCHCLITGRRSRESCDNMDVCVYLTYHHLGNK